jgi:hypothetical protein
MTDHDARLETIQLLGLQLRKLNMLSARLPEDSVSNDFFDERIKALRLRVLDELIFALGVHIEVEPLLAPLFEQQLYERRLDRIITSLNIRQAELN